MTKWPKHIEECIKASLEHGPDARFETDWCEDNCRVSHSLQDVIGELDLHWHYVPPKPPYIEQWGNEYDLSTGVVIRWKPLKGE